MNQKALQPRLDKGVDRPLYFLPVAAVIAGHQFIDGQTAVHLKMEDGLRFLERENAVGHKPGNIMFLMVRHFVDDPCENRIVQQQVTEHVVAVNFVAERIGTVG